MNPKIARVVIALALVILSQIACATGGHGIDVNLGSNGCGVVACTNKPNQTSITIR